LLISIATRVRAACEFPNKAITHPQTAPTFALQHICFLKQQLPTVDLVAPYFVQISQRLWLTAPICQPLPIRLAATGFGWRSQDHFSVTTCAHDCTDVRQQRRQLRPTAQPRSREANTTRNSRAPLTFPPPLAYSPAKVCCTPE
jgi:hypothetical protein